HHVDANTSATDTGDQRTQRGRGTPAATDHLAQIVWMNMDLDGASTPAGHHVHPDIVGVVDDPPDQVLDSVDDDGTHCARQLSSDAAAGSPLSDCSAPSADVSACSALAASGAAFSGFSASAFSASTSALAAFLAGDFFFGLAASVVGPPSAAARAALNSSSLLGFSGLTFREPSAPGR